MHAVQNSGSNAFMEKKLPTAKLNSAQSDAAHARAIAHVRPPSSRAMTPVRETVTAPAATGASEPQTTSRLGMLRSIVEARSRAAADRYSQNRDVERRLCNRAHRESNRSARLSGDGPATLPHLTKRLRLTRRSNFYSLLGFPHS